MGRRNVAVLLGIVAVIAFVFFVPIVPSTFATDSTMPCALHQGYFCPFGSPTSQNPSGMITYHLWSSLSYSIWGMGTVYSPDSGDGLWFIG